MDQYVVTFKHEDQIQGQPVGPVSIYTRVEIEAAKGSFGVPYNPGQQPRWVTLREAQQIAQEHGAILEEY